MLDNVGIVGRTIARNLIVQCHYSQIMPRITRFCIGGWQSDKLVAVMTLGYGTRPLHTIRGMFPSLGTDDYLEIGKLCVRDEQPPNTESYFLSRAINIVREQCPSVRVLYSWADGILGKPGYVYQASNFFYGGHIWTEIYLDERGIKVHPRTVQGLTARGDGQRGPRDFASTRALGLTKYFGKQFRYLYPLCSKREWAALQEESPHQWRRHGYPKDVDCTWQVQVAPGERRNCGLPPFVRGAYVKQTIAQMAGQLNLTEGR